MQSLTDINFWLSQLTEIGVLVAIAYGSGRIAERGVRVNYTRKIVHFAIFFVPVFIADIFPFVTTAATTAVGGALFFLLLGLMTRPARSRSGFAMTTFRSFDRPEDRPHSLLWLTTQIIAGYAVLLPLGYLLAGMGLAGLIYIPILVNGIGDGLAEPVGVRFGKHHYEVRAIFSDRTYRRTLEGSACVFVTAVLVTIFFRDAFTTTQFVAALIALPVGLTLAEARAPHTWDTPFLFGAGGGLLLAIVKLI